jgi:hypothetical protein
MGRNDCLANMNKVYVHMKTTRKDQPVIRLRYMEEKFGGQTMRKKGRASTQHGVPTNQLADMDGPNVCLHQPRPWYIGAEDKFIAEYRQHVEEQFMVLGDQIKALTTQISNLCGNNEIGCRNPFIECRMQGHQHLMQAHANRRVSRFKLNTLEFQGCLQFKEFIETEKLEKFNKKKVPRETVEIRSQSVEVEGDGFIEEDCSIDWHSPPIYDTYPDEEVSFIHQVDFLGVDAIMSKTFNQSCDEIYGVETTFFIKD